MDDRIAKRISKEIELMQKSHSETFTIKLINNDIKHWIIGFNGAKDTIY